VLGDPLKIFARAFDIREKFRAECVHRRTREVASDAGRMDKSRLVNMREPSDDQLVARQRDGLRRRLLRLGVVPAARRGTVIMSDARPEFAVWVFWPDSHYPVLEFVGVEEAMRMATALIHVFQTTAEQPVERVIIIDGGDHTVFEWQSKEGLVWPR
jgi:hypothetical protein